MAEPGQNIFSASAARQIANTGSAAARLPSVLAETATQEITARESLPSEIIAPQAAALKSASSKTARAKIASQKIAGIVLTGGKSSRMGRNKALLSFRGRPLIAHMLHILAGLGLSDIFVSGGFADFPCIKDDVPFSGPMGGIKSVLRHRPNYQGYIFIPVDMPLLSKQLLQILLAQPQSAYFAASPLPAYLAPPFAPSESASVRDFLAAQNARALELPAALAETMKNANHPQDWQEIIEHYENKICR